MISIQREYTIEEMISLSLSVSMIVFTWSLLTMGALLIPFGFSPFLPLGISGAAGSAAFLYFLHTIVPNEEQEIVDIDDTPGAPAVQDDIVSIDNTYRIIDHGLTDAKIKEVAEIVINQGKALSRSTIVGPGILSRHQLSTLQNKLVGRGMATRSEGNRIILNDYTFKWLSSYLTPPDIGGLDLA